MNAIKLTSTVGGIKELQLKWKLETISNECGVIENSPTVPVSCIVLASTVTDDFALHLMEVDSQPG